MASTANTVPENANEGCVGPSSEQAGKVSGCAGCPNQAKCASGEAKAVDPALAQVQDKMSGVKHKILVLSGKGGVGKSTFSSQLAFTLALQGFQVGLLDVDICGPSIPRMTGLVGMEVHQSASGWSPVYVEENLAVMSIGFMLPTSDDAVIWRGPRKNGLIKQFLTDVVWNDLDYLIIDTPPGTSDEHISLVQLLKTSTVDGAIVVTTPQEVSMADVRKELNFCRKTSLPVLGVVENMHSIRVPMAYAEAAAETGVRLVDRAGVDRTDRYLAILREKCPELLAEMCVESFLFAPTASGPAQLQDGSSRSEGDGAGSSSSSSDDLRAAEADFNSVLGDAAVPPPPPTASTSTSTSKGPQSMATRFGVPYLGQLPMDRNLMQACEDGVGFLAHYPHSVAAQPLTTIVERLKQALCGQGSV